jgi:glycosyltransferase involved in cell wall biosynthesis
VPLISGVINTYQEAGNIRTSIASLRGWCDEVIVVDQHSTDGTAQIAAAEGATVVLTEPTGFVEAARQVAIDAAQGTWIVVLDADELVHPELAKELRRIAETDTADVVRIPRKNIMLGRWMRYGMWWPNCKPRFFKKASMTITDRIHMGLRPAKGARVVELPWTEQMAIWHYSYHSLEDLVEKSNRYSSVEARQAGTKRSSRANPLGMLRAAGRNLWDEYLRDGGYRDGTAALAVAVTRAYYRFLVLAKTWDEPAARHRVADYERSKRELLGLPPESASAPEPPATGHPATGTSGDAAAD